MRAMLTDRRLQAAVLGLLALVVVYNTRHFAGRARKSKGLIEHEIIAEASGDGDRVPNWASGTYAVASDWERDPFVLEEVPARRESRPRGATQPAATTRGKPQITAIGQLEGSGFVMVDGRILRPGDPLAGGTIKSIDENSVVVQYENGTRTIRTE